MVVQNSRVGLRILAGGEVNVGLDMEKRKSLNNIPTRAEAGREATHNHVPPYGIIEV